MAPPSAPDLQEVQIPKPLALPIMLWHRPVMLASSPALSVPGVNGVSVDAVPVPCACRVVPHGAMPETILGDAAVAALLLQPVPVPEPLAPASVASFTVTGLGTTPVRVLEVASATTPRLTV